MTVRNRHGERGQAMVEFSMAAFVALILIFGILEFGRALFTYDVVANAARIGARYAIVRGADSCAGNSGCTVTTATVQSYVRSESPGVTVASLGVATTWPGNAECLVSPYTAPGCPVKVVVTYPFTFLAFSWAAISMSSTSQMVISQ